MLFLFFLTLFGHTLGFDPAQYDHKQVVWQQSNNMGEKEDIYTIHWSIKMKTIKIAFVVKTTGWIGFGIAEQTSGTMGGSDVLQGFVKNGTVEFKDRYVLRQIPGTNTFTTPLDDTCQDWELISGEEMGGMTILEVSRLLDTGDSQDRPILPNGNTKIILAYGADEEDVFDSYHTRERRLATFLDFSAALHKDPLASLKSRSDIEVFDFFGNFNVTTNEESIKKQAEDIGAIVGIVDDVTTYFNFFMDLTHLLQDGDIHILGVEDIIMDDTRDLVHHFVLYGLFYNGTDDVQSSNNIYGWAPGVDPLVMDKCGFRASKTTGIDTLYLQTHYDNPHKKEGIVDTSGVRIYYTKEPLAHECGYLNIGQANKVDNQDPFLVPGKTKYVYECLDIGLDKDGNDLDWDGIPEITIFMEILHMHAVGREQWAEIKRDDGVWVKTGNIEFWDFNFQSLQKPLIGEYKLKKGDSIRVTCIYETPLGKETTKFGLASLDEMCLQAMLFYPRISSIEGLCSYTSTDGKTNRTVETEVEYVTDFGSTSCENILLPTTSPTIIEDNEAEMKRTRSTILFIVAFSIYLYLGIQ